MSKLSVLVVDDDPAIRELLKLVLESRGCDVVMAEDGQ
jgi:CheY-like chemotaxis protein